MHCSIGAGGSCCDPTRAAAARGDVPPSQPTRPALQAEAFPFSGGAGGRLLPLRGLLRSRAALREGMAAAAPAAQAPALSDSQKLQLVVGNCVQKATELILHARLSPLPASLRRGAVNRWVRSNRGRGLTHASQASASAR